MASPSNRTNPADPIEILLVEDNPGDVRLVREAFATTGRESTLHVVTGGADAVEFLTRRVEADSVPDIVLLDLNLPGPDGCDVLETIRESPALQRLPVVVLSSSGADEDVERCYESGANAYLRKPDSMGEFAALARCVEGFWFERAQLPPVSG